MNIPQEIAQGPEPENPPQLRPYAAHMEYECSCAALTLPEYGERVRHMAGLMGHDSLGHRIMHKLLTHGYHTVEEVAAVDPDIIFDLPKLGDGARRRIKKVILAELGTWPRHWTIRRACNVLDIVRSSLLYAPVQHVPTIFALWEPLLQDVWDEKITPGAPGWEERLTPIWNAEELLK